MQTGTKNILIVAILLTTLQVAAGCGHPRKATDISIKEDTYQPLFDPAPIRICVMEDDPASEPIEGDYLLSDADGIKLLSAADAFHQPFVPNFSKVGEGIFIEFEEKSGGFDEYSIYDAAFAKMRTLSLPSDQGFTKQIAFSDDGRYAAIGVGKPDESADLKVGLWILDTHGMPDPVTVAPKLPDGERAATIFPLLIEEEQAHALIMSESGPAYYQVCSLSGELQFSFRLPDTQYDMPPAARPIPGPGGKRYLLGALNGFVAISPANEGAILTELNPVSYTVGVVGGDTPYAVWLSFDPDGNATTAWRHDMASGTNMPIFLIRKNLRPEVMRTTALLPDKQALLVVLDGDLWRFDMRVGIAGRVWETPDVNELLVWAS